MAESRANPKASQADRIHELKIDRNAPHVSAHRDPWLGLALGLTAAIAIAWWHAGDTAGGAVLES